MIPDKFSKKIEVLENGCWLWTGSISGNGYGVAHIGRQTTSAHRAVFIEVRGSIPNGLELDHLCRSKRCVNPEHLEPVTRDENMRRYFESVVPKTVCKHGHHLDGVRTRQIGGRYCKTCVRLRKQKQRLAGKKN